MRLSLGITVLVKGQAATQAAIATKQLDQGRDTLLSRLAYVVAQAGGNLLRSPFHLLRIRDLRRLRLGQLRPRPGRPRLLWLRRPPPLGHRLGGINNTRLLRHNPVNQRRQVRIADLRQLLRQRLGGGRGGRAVWLIGRGLGLLDRLRNGRGIQTGFLNLLRRIRKQIGQFAAKIPLRCQHVLSVKYPFTLLPQVILQVLLLRITARIKNLASCTQQRLLRSIYVI